MPNPAATIPDWEPTASRSVALPDGFWRTWAIRSRPWWMVRRATVDTCGLTGPAQVAVDASFVDTATAAIVLSQMIRMIVDGIRPAVLGIDLGQFSTEV